MVASLLLFGCVGGGNNATDEVCTFCGGNCFDCGSGCVCDGNDASVGSTWQPPIADLGEPGTWRSASEPTFCPGATTLDSVDLWSDDRGVFVMLAGATAVNSLPAEQPDPGGMDLPSGGAGGVAGGSAGIGGGVAGVGGISPGGCFSNSCTGESIWFNDGVSGWQRAHERHESNSFGTRRLSGIPGTSPVLYGADESGITSCSLGRVVDDTWVCDRASGAGTRSVSAFFAVSGTLAYAAVGRDLLRFDGETWSTYGPQAPVDVQTLWADDRSVVALGFDGNVMLLRDELWTEPAPNLRARSVWGTTGDDVWFTDFGSQLWHFDGLVATMAATIPSESCFRDDAFWLWGSGNRLFVYGQHSMQRWDGTQFENVMSWNCGAVSSATITRVWGNGPNEVFVLLRDFSRFAFDSCGDGAVLYFDGTTFHSL